jgi:hypothetical protein
VRYQLRHAPGLRAECSHNGRDRPSHTYGSVDTVCRMTKTTVDIPDDLLVQAKALAAHERTTLREIVERGLRLVVRRRGPTERFRLRDASVDGDGLNPEFEGASWDRIRDALYDSDR